MLSSKRVVFLLRMTPLYMRIRVGVARTYRALLASKCGPLQARRGVRSAALPPTCIAT